MPQLRDQSNVQETQQALPEVNNSSHLEDDRLIARARAVGLDYVFAKLENLFLSGDNY